MGIIFGLSYAIIVSLGKIVLKNSLSEFNSSVTFFLETFFGIIIWVPISFLLGANINEVVSVFPIALMGAILSEAYIFYIYTKGDISVIGTVFPTYSIFTVLFASIILGESLSTLELLAVIITIFGTLLIASSKSHIDLNRNIKPALWALSGALAVGIADTLAKGQINNTSAFSFLVALAIAQIPVSLVFLKLEKSDIKDVFLAFKQFEKYKLPILSAFLIALAQVFFWFAFEGTLASIASPITSTNTAFTFIFAIVLLKEKIKKDKLVGVILVIIGIIIISLTS